MRSTSSFSVVVLARIALLVLALTAMIVAWIATRPHDAVATNESYVCPMHSEVTSHAPGDCPICKMALERVVEPNDLLVPSARGEQKGDLELSEQAAVRVFGSTSRAKLYDMALEMRVPGWADGADSCVAKVRLDEKELLKPGEKAIFYPSSGETSRASAAIAVHLADDPPTEESDATALVRLRADDGSPFSPGQTGSIKFATRIRNDLVVKASSILHSPEGTYVLVVSDDRRVLTKRKVVVGNVLYGYADIVSGLRENEYVVAAHTFFLDAERRLRERSRP